ncbi:MAG: aldehyde dehydrogenase family protein, partial [Devosia sp.]
MRMISNYPDSSTTSIRTSDVFDPNTGLIQAQVRLAGAADLDGAVRAALKAQPDWAATNPQRRARVMFAFRTLIERDMDVLAQALSAEHGKVISDARGDIQRGLEVI